MSWKSSRKPKSNTDRHTTSASALSQEIQPLLCNLGAKTRRTRHKVVEPVWSPSRGQMLHVETRYPQVFSQPRVPGSLPRGSKSGTSRFPPCCSFPIRLWEKCRELAQAKRPSRRMEKQLGHGFSLRMVWSIAPTFQPRCGVCSSRKRAASSLQRLMNNISRGFREIISRNGGPSCLFGVESISKTQFSQCLSNPYYLRKRVVQSSISKCRPNAPKKRSPSL